MTIEYGNGNTLCADGLYTALNYTLSQTQGLSNGDTITITVSAADEMRTWMVIVWKPMAGCPCLTPANMW